MSAENTRPNPGNVINRIRDDIPKSFNSTRRSRASIGNYGSEDESQLDTLKNLSSLHDNAAPGGSNPHRRQKPRSAGSDIGFSGRKSKPLQEQKKRENKMRRRREHEAEEEQRRANDNDQYLYWGGGQGSEDDAGSEESFSPGAGD